MDTAELEAIKALRAVRRARNNCLAQHPDLVNLINAARSLKNPTVRHQVQEIIRCGLENADDTCSEAEYARECADPRWGRDFTCGSPNRAAWWRSMFYTSAQSCTCDARYIIGCELNGHAKRWLHQRGLMG